jgi:outer membrane receptor for ferrienterochelin and colicins
MTTIKFYWARYDYNNNHGSIFTRDWLINGKLMTNILRFNTGTGFRIVNLFTEEHAALTGSRSNCYGRTETRTSFNANLNYLKKIYTNNGTFMWKLPPGIPDLVIP